MEDVYKIIEPKKKDDKSYWIVITEHERFQGLIFKINSVKIIEDEDSDVLQVISHYEIVKSIHKEINLDNKTLKQELNTLVSKIAWDILSKRKLKFKLEDLEMGEK